MSDVTLCRHCGHRIVRPQPGSYPPDVPWVHKAAGPMNERGNRWCTPLPPHATAAPAEEVGDVRQ